MSSHASILVVADDLTGANATAAGFARAGLRAVTVGADQDAAMIAEFSAGFDVVVVSTATRHSPPDEAAARASRIVTAGWPVRLVCNRVDSTLRGNLGSSTQAVLDAAAACSKRRTVALCLPAHPAAGRQTVDGTQLLGGVRLEDTELAKDPRTPLRDSRVAELFRQQSDLRVAHLPLSTVTAGATELGEAIRARLAEGAELIIADALTEHHLDRVAQAAVTTDVDWISVDPGPGSLALAKALGLTATTESAPFLVLSGSATDLTRRQLARLREERQVIEVVPRYTDRGSLDITGTADALSAALAQAQPNDVVALATVWEAADIAKLSPAEAERLPVSLAKAALAAITQRPVDGIFVTGGDAAAALFTELGATGLDVEREVVPLAVAGNLVGGDWDALPVVTKGGLIGDSETTIACVDQLRDSAEAARRRVSTARSSTRLNPVNHSGGTR